MSRDSSHLMNFWQRGPDPKIQVTEHLGLRASKLLELHQDYWRWWLSEEKASWVPMGVSSFWTCCSLEEARAQLKDSVIQHVGKRTVWSLSPSSTLALLPLSLLPVYLSSLILTSKDGPRHLDSSSCHCQASKASYTLPWSRREIDLGRWNVQDQAGRIWDPWSLSLFLGVCLESVWNKNGYNYPN